MKKKGEKQMKKKILAAVLSAAVICAVLPTAVFAEEETVEISWEDISEDYIENATWIACFDVFDILLPNEWEVLVNVDLEEGEPEDGVFFQAADMETGMNAAVTYGDGGSDIDFETLAESLEEEGFEGFEEWTVNDIAALYYYSDDVAAISALDEDGGVYTVVIALPDDSEETIDTALNILSSFSQHEEA